MPKAEQHFLDRGDGAAVELFAARPDGPGPAGAILLVHGNQGGQRLGAREAVESGVLLRYCRDFNVTAAAVSQPGFGRSEGPPDFSGPQTQSAIAAALAFLRAQRGVDLDRIVLYGNSRGAIASAMVATRDVALRAVLLRSGVYDLKAAFESGPLGLRSTIEKEAGLSEEALAARSALTHACEITCEVMLLHGRQDERAQLSQAERFSQAITAAGAEASLHVFDCGHRIPRVQLDPVLCPFLRKIFDPATRLH